MADPLKAVPPTLTVSGELAGKIVSATLSLAYMLPETRLGDPDVQEALGVARAFHLDQAAARFDAAVPKRSVRTGADAGKET